MSQLHLYDFGIFLDLMPDEDQKAMLENNIQVALAQQSIDLEDAIDLREIKNIKLANQLLKLRRKKKQQKEQQIAQENMKAQAEANAEQQQAAAQAEIQKQQVLVQSEIQMEQAKAKMKQQTLQVEAEVKKILMDHEFEINLKLKTMDIESNREKDNTRENRTDRRQAITGVQQKELMKEREQVKEKPFESSGNDVLGGGMRLGAFEPK